MNRFLCLTFFVSCFSFAQNEVIWEKKIGGEYSEYLYNSISTPDYGFLLIGSSDSNATGDVEKQNQGDLDYFIWKMNEHGGQEWQNSFGGNGRDLLYNAKNTSDGGYILVGSSNSSKSGDKSQDNQGANDIWIIKIDALGQIQWEKTFGGNGDDIPVDVIVTSKNEYLIAAVSNSDYSELKNASTYGANDYYLIKLDHKGKIIWEKTYGGEYDDRIQNITEVSDGFLLIGTSNSGISGNKSIDQQNGGIWLVKINYEGDIIQQSNLGQTEENQLISFQKNDKNLTFSLKKYSSNDPLLIQTDFNLNNLQTKELKIDQKLNISSIAKYGEQYVVTANESTYNNGNHSAEDAIRSYYVASSYSSDGRRLWNKKFGNGGYNFLQKSIETRDGDLILFGTSMEGKNNGKGLADFYLIKLGKKERKEERKFIEVYPNPTSNIVNVLINTDFQKATIEIYNLVGQKIGQEDVKNRSTPIQLAKYPSGIYILKIKYDNQEQSIKIIKK